MYYVGFEKGGSVVAGLGEANGDYSQHGKD
jgi:hypothetical protein